MASQAAGAGSDRGGAPGRSRGVVLAWMPVSRRSETLAHRLGFERLLLGRTGFRRPWSAPLAYPLLAIRTMRALARLRPQAIVVIAPPPIAPLVVLPCARLLRARVAIDIHSGAFLDRRWRWSVPLLRWLARRASCSVVTLDSLAPLLTGAVVRTIPDPLPDLESGVAAAASPPTDGLPEVVAVCSWSPDEPIDALAEAARGQPWRLAITGRPNRTLDAPPNVALTGFLAGQAYVDRLAQAAAVVVLTTRDQTLLSGSWEAISLARPLIVSGTAALRETFGEAAVYVDPTPASIASGVSTVLADPDAAASALKLRDRFRAANDEALAGLAACLGVTTEGRPRGG